MTSPVAQMTICTEAKCRAMHRMPREIAASQTACPKCGGRLKHLCNLKSEDRNA